MENTIDLISNHIVELNFASYYMTRQSAISKYILTLRTMWTIHLHLKNRFPKPHGNNIDECSIRQASIEGVIRTNSNPSLGPRCRECKQNPTLSIRKGSTALKPDFRVY